MRGRVVLLALCLALAAAFLTRGAGPRPAPPVPAASAPVRSVSEAPPAPSPGWPSRDPFRYFEDELAASPAGAPASPAAGALETQAAPPPAPLRFVGWVRRGERLLAALAIHGVVVTAGAGEMVEGYRVLSVDEDAGVRLQGPTGSEISLTPQPY